MANKKEESKELVKNPEAQVPDFLRDMKGRGSEQVSHEDIAIPRIEVCQSLSKCRKRADPAYIEGIQEGDLYNTVTKEIYGGEVTIVPVYFNRTYLLWRDQKNGGGFGGSYPNQDDAEAARLLQEKPEEWESVLTHEHFVLILRPGCQPTEAVVACSKSKLRVSKKFNSLVRVQGGDRFAHRYALHGVADQNANGQDFFNLGFEYKGFVDEPTYRAAEKTYDMIVQGRYRVDHGDGADTAEEAESTEY